jgi:hypothetical protein
MTLTRQQLQCGVSINLIQPSAALVHVATVDQTYVLRSTLDTRATTVN